MSLLFFHAVFHSKNHVIPHPVITDILDDILNECLNISKRRTQQQYASQTLWIQPLLKTIGAKAINCDQVEFCFKMAGIWDTILNIWTFWTKQIFHLNRLNHKASKTAIKIQK